MYLYSIKEKKDEELIKDIKNNKIAIYTAFTGDYDSLKDPRVIDEIVIYMIYR